MSKLGGKKIPLYHFIRELIQEGKYAWFVNQEGRFRIKWDNAVERYIEYRAKKNPSYDLNIDRKKASNSFREGLLRRYRDDADGPKEYEDCQKVGENKKIVEREFQMPSDVFRLLFGTSKELPGDQMSPKVFQSPFGSKEELSVDSTHETSNCASTSSEVDEKLQVFPDSGISDASDTGFEEAMDVSDDSFDMNATGTAPQGNKREDPVDLTNVATPYQIFDISNKDLLDSALEEINNSDSDVNQPEVVQVISPSSGSMKGGIPFHLMLKEALLESDTTGVANFDGIGDVPLAKTNPYTFSGLVPAAQKAGDVLITVYTEAGRELGITYFTYVDEMREAFQLLIENPNLHTEFLNMWLSKHGITGINSNVALTLGLFGLSDQGSLPDAEQVQSLKVLQLLVYTAAQVGAQQFLEVIFSTSTGKIVFDSYKDRTPLPEDVARANGHGKVAEFLQDVNKRLSKEHDSNSVALGTSDWLELVQEIDNIQKQTVSIDEQESSRMQPKDDDNQSGYFADAETSSCGSLDLVGDWSDLEEENGACTKDGDCKKATIETGNDNCASMPHYPQEELLGNSVEFTKENAATKESFEDETQLGNGQDNFKRLERLICRDSLRLKDMLESFSFKKEPLRSCVIRRSLAEDVATLESLEDETQLVNGQDNFERCSICRESSLLKGMRRKLCSLRAEEKGSESLKKGTERRDDSSSRRKYATESLDQEKTTRLHFENETICEKCSVVNHIAVRNLFSSFPNRFFQERDTSSRLLRPSSLLEIQSERTERRDDSGSRQKYTTESLDQEKMTKLHYPQGEPLRVTKFLYLVSLEENAATLESFEDETQLGNGQDNFERCTIYRESSLLKGMRRKLCSLQAEEKGSESLISEPEPDPYCYTIGEKMKRRDDSGSAGKNLQRSVGYEGKTFHLMNTSKAKEETSRQCKNHLTKGKQET